MTRMVGWRERAALPELGISEMSAKMDTGALSCSLHAEDICIVDVDGVDKVCFRPAGSELVAKAGLMTAVMVAGITMTAFITNKDFSFLSGILTIGGFVALGIIVASILFGFGLGLIFSGAMAIFASVSILHSTSNIIHHYPPGKHVAASLQLFAGIALLFWYILQILIALSGRD